MWAMLGLRPAPKGIRLRINSNYKAVSSEVKKSIMMQMINKPCWIIYSVQQKERFINNPIADEVPDMLSTHGVSLTLPNTTKYSS